MQGKNVVKATLAALTAAVAFAMGVFYCTTGDWKAVDLSKVIAAVVLLTLGFGLIWWAWSVHNHKTDVASFVVVGVLWSLGIFVTAWTLFGTLPFYGRDVRHEAALVMFPVLVVVTFVLAQGYRTARARSQSPPAAAA